MQFVLVNTFFFCEIILYLKLIVVDNVQKLIAAQEPLRSEISCVQKLIKDHLSVLKSTLASHNKIISDVRVLLKSLTKVSAYIYLIIIVTICSLLFIL